VEKASFLDRYDLSKWVDSFHAKFPALEECQDGNTIQGFESEVTKARKVREEQEKKQEEKRKKNLEREAKEAEKTMRANKIAAALEIKAQLLEKQKKQEQKAQKDKL
jgi:hypothetical protein